MKKASSSKRRRFARAFKAALAAGLWNAPDYPIVLKLERLKSYCRTWRGQAPAWRWVPMDSWSIDVAAAGAAEFLEGYQSLRFNRDETTGEGRGALYDQPLFVARLTAIANAAWTAGVRTLEARLDGPLSGHDAIELGAEAARWPDPR